MIDTNVLLAAVQLNNSRQAEASGAIQRLLSRGERLVIGIQNAAEFWNVATRPIDKNGFGFSQERAEAELDRIEGRFPMVSEDLSSYRIWRGLVSKYQVRGVQVHDARLASVMGVHNIQHILTFNVRDFARYPGITALHPSELRPMI